MSNPFTTLLVAALPDDVEARYFSWRQALLWNYQVLHVHWPELLTRRPGKIAGRTAPLLLCLLLTRLTVLGVPVVRTVHNAVPHERGRWWEHLLIRWMDRLTVGYVLLTEHTPLPGSGSVHVIPHGDYTEWFAEHPREQPVADRALFFGLLRPYKGLDALLAAFAAVPPGRERLRVVGRPATAQIRASVEGACAADPRVSARLEYVDDAATVEEITRAALVVLPYEDMHNSGALLLALSLDRPVLVPANQVTSELQREVGEQWVVLYEGELSADDIRDALARAAQLASGARPDLSRRRWQDLGAQHAHAYRAALNSRRRSTGVVPSSPGS